MTLYPTAVVVWLSLSRTRYYDVIGWAGLGNYVSVLTSAAFWDLTFNSLIYMAGSLAIVLPVGLFCRAGAANDEARRLVSFACCCCCLGRCPWLSSAAFGCGCSTRLTGPSATQ